MPGHAGMTMSTGREAGRLTCPQLRRGAEWCAAARQAVGRVLVLPPAGCFGVSHHTSAEFNVLCIFASPAHHDTV